MKTCLVLLITFISASIGVAQDQDYAITLKSDTIYGKVSISSYEGSGQQISIKTGKRKTQLKAHEVRSLSTKKGVFHTLKIRNQYQFARLEKEGYLSYYKFSGNSTSASLSFDTPLLVKKTSEQKEIPNIGFRKQVSTFLSDCESVSMKIKNGVYKKNDLTQIIDDYNQYIDDNTSDINKKQEVISQNFTKSELINHIKEAVNNSSSLNNKVEIKEMLNDVQAKLQAGEEIPNYLIGALKEKLSSEPEMMENLLRAVE